MFFDAFAGAASGFGTMFNSKAFFGIFSGVGNILLKSSVRTRRGTRETQNSRDSHPETFKMCFWMTPEVLERFTLGSFEFLVAPINFQSFRSETVPT